MDPKLDKTKIMDPKVFNDPILKIAIQISSTVFDSDVKQHNWLIAAGPQQQCKSFRLH